MLLFSFLRFTFLLLIFIFMGPDILLFVDLFTVLLFYFAWFLFLCICSLLLPK